MNKRDVFPPLIFLVLLLSGIFNCAAQMLSSASSALQLCARPRGSSSPLTLAVNEVGEVLVVWSDSSAWTDATPALLDRELPPGNVAQVYALEGESWTGVHTIRVQLTGGTVGWTKDFHFSQGRGGTLLQSSDVFQTDAREVNMNEPGSGASATTISLCGWRYGDTVIIERNQEQYSTWAGISASGIESEILRWSPGNQYASLYKIFSGSGSHTWADSSRGMLRVSAPLENECVVYQRTELPDDQPFSGNTQHFIRAISLLHPGTGALQPFIPLDTLHVRGLDLSDAVLPRRGSSIEILRRDMNVDNLFMERFDFRGKKQDSVQLVERAHVYQVRNDTLAREKAMAESGMTRADYAALPLDSGRTLLAWATPITENKNELRMALFDADWRRIGPEHIVSDGEGWRVHPALAARDQHIYVVWQHRLPQGSTPWMRAYAMDGLLSGSNPAHVSGMVLDAPWPQPAANRVHVSVRGVPPGAELRLTLFDALGRIVMKQAHASPAQLAADVSTLRDGWYTMLVSTANEAKATRFSVIRGGMR